MSCMDNGCEKCIHDGVCKKKIWYRIKKWWYWEEKCNHFKGVPQYIDRSLPVNEVAVIVDNQKAIVCNVENVMSTYKQKDFAFRMDLYVKKEDFEKGVKGEKNETY